MARRGRIVRFWRGARRHPKWDLGVPPNPRARQQDHSRRRYLHGRRARWALALLLVLLLGPSLADVVNGLVKPQQGCRVLAVVDGDTVRVNCPRSGYGRGRILGFDAPEITPPRCPSELVKGLAATYYLRWQLWTAREITALPRGVDRYGRQLILMGLDGEGIAQDMIDRGLARRYDGGPRASWCG